MGAAWSTLSPDDLLKYGLAALVAVLVVGFPGQIRRSLLRWFDDPAPHRTPSPPSRPGLNIGVRLKRLVRPTLLLVPADLAGFSKLGGDPEFPPDLEWPSGYERPPTFLAQIDLWALGQPQPIDWLPQKGRLYAFYDPDGHGCADVVRVLYSTEAPGPPVPPPANVKWRFPERRVTFKSCTSAPSLEWLNLDSSDVDFDEKTLQDLEKIANAPPPDDIQHRIGGYPNEIQDECMRLSCEHLARNLPDPVWVDEIPPAVDRASKTWRLLLQIDSDPELKMNFGDGGRLYVFVREMHARAGIFSKTVTLWQTY